MKATVLVLALFEVKLSDDDVAENSYEINTTGASP